MKRVKVFVLFAALVAFGAGRPAQAGLLGDLGDSISKPFRNARDWVGEQIYKGSGAKHLMDGLEQAGNRLIGKAGLEAREVIKEAKKEIKSAIDAFDGMAKRRLEQANQLVDKLNSITQKRLRQVEGIANRIIDKVDYKIKRRLKELRVMQTQLNRNAKARLKQLDDIIKTRLNAAEKAAKRVIIRAGAEANQAINNMQQVVNFIPNLIKSAKNQGGLEGAKMLAHARHQLINLNTGVKGKGWLASKLGNMQLKFKRTRPTIMRTFPRNGHFNQRNPFKRAFLVIQDLPPGYSMAGKVKAFFKRKEDGKVIPLETTSPEQVLLIVSLRKGNTLAPGHYSLYLKLFRTRHKKQLLKQREQPAPVEILQEGVGFFTITYTIQHKGQIYHRSYAVEVEG